MIVPSEVNDAYKLGKSKHTLRLCEGVYVGFSMYICMHMCVSIVKKKTWRHIVGDCCCCAKLIGPNL